MVLFNHATREMTAKIVYYGPGLCGKTTNLMVIFDKLDPKSKGKMLSLATKTDRTLFFDLLPVDIGKVGPFNLKIQLYTVPGQVFYNETRKLVLKGADSVVFVADSQPAMVDANRESFANLLENLTENQIDPNDTPVIIQYNKRDIPGVLPVEDLQRLLSFEGYPYCEASALRGDGVMETFKLASKITAKHLFARLKGKSEPVRREAPSAAKVSVQKAAPVAAPAPPATTANAFASVAEPASAPINPFADSMPFGAPADEPQVQYDTAQEVSLEDLLAEGRERPATMSGAVAIPDYEPEVEELGAESLVAVADEPVAVSFAAEGEDLAPAGGAEETAALQARIETLEANLEALEREHTSLLESLLADTDLLAQRLRRALDR
ncbi:MAG: GTPase domain-containing protein [Thermoanaerobaculia bacterium]